MLGTARIYSTFTFGFFIALRLCCFFFFAEKIVVAEALAVCAPALQALAGAAAGSNKNAAAIAMVRNRMIIPPVFMTKAG